MTPSEHDPLGAFMIGPQLLVAGGGGTLSGMRFAVKDLFDVAGYRTGAGNPDWLEDAEPATRTAPAVQALLDAGADLWGKTITDELAFSLSGTNVHYGTPKNPAAPGRVPGGSSSGSASAVAGGAVDLALGTDTGGSVRVPSSYCGIFGLRPTHGRISERGLVPLAPSFDTVGLLARKGGVLARAWAALSAGASDGDRTPLPAREIRRIVSATDLFALADRDAAAALRESVAAMATRLGLTLEEKELAGSGDLDRWRDSFRAIQLVEAWQCDGEWITRRSPDLGGGIASRFAAAKAADPARADEARLARSEILQRMSDLLGDDAILAQPATSGPAPPFELASAMKDDLRNRTLTLTAPAGMAGAPVITLPQATLDGLPLGLALVGLPGNDDSLVGLASALEEPD